MKAWEKAKEKFPALSRMDFIQQTCPDLAGVADKMPDICFRRENCTDAKGCETCWDREVEG